MNVQIMSLGPTVGRGWGGRVWSLVLHRAKKLLAMIRSRTIKLKGRMDLNGS